MGSENEYSQNHTLHPHLISYVISKNPSGNCLSDIDSVAGMVIDIFMNYIIDYISLLS